MSGRKRCSLPIRVRKSPNKDPQDFDVCPTPSETSWNTRGFGSLSMAPAILSSPLPKPPWTAGSLSGLSLAAHLRRSSTNGTDNNYDAVPLPLLQVSISMATLPQGCHPSVQDYTALSNDTSLRSSQAVATSRFAISPESPIIGSTRNSALESSLPGSSSVNYGLRSASTSEVSHTKRNSFEVVHKNKNVEPRRKRCASFEDLRLFSLGNNESVTYSSNSDKGASALKVVSRETNSEDILQYPTSVQAEVNESSRSQLATSTSSSPRGTYGRLESRWSNWRVQPVTAASSLLQGLRGRGLEREKGRFREKQGKPNRAEQRLVVHTDADSYAAGWPSYIVERRPSMPAISATRRDKDPRKRSAPTIHNERNTSPLERQKVAPWEMMDKNEVRLAAMSLDLENMDITQRRPTVTIGQHYGQSSQALRGAEPQRKDSRKTSITAWPSTQKHDNIYNDSSDDAEEDGEIVLNGLSPRPRK
ncbi:hypothetical protein BDZ91DRAFT_714246 [Kalaharituber pfeilii]|nr:hypothetical protein BDZ91DRAFT_714246 [Kalaharituber pfeilii]